MEVAMQDPERIEKLVVLNSWLWPLDRSPLFQLYSRVMGSGIGSWAIRTWNILIRWGMPLGFADPRRFDRNAREAYESPFRDPRSRKGQWTFAKHILRSKGWFRSLWEQRGVLQHKPMLILKGTKDRAFTERSLRKWVHGFPRATVERIPDAGHFPHEEQGPRVAKGILDLMRA